MKSFGEELHELDCLTTFDKRPQEYFTFKLFGRTYDHLKPQTYTLDRKFLAMSETIDRNFRSTFYSKPDQVRVEQWLKRLCEHCCDRQPLMKNRNRYAKLLRLCVTDIKRLEGVFKKMPPAIGEELKMIQNHEVLEIEHFAQCKKTKKQKNSQRRAKEMYEFNQQKARE